MKLDPVYLVEPRRQATSRQAILSAGLVGVVVGCCGGFLCGRWGASRSIAEPAIDLVIPRVYENTDASSTRWVAGLTADLRQQILVDAQLLEDLAGKDLTSLSFRRDAAYVEPLVGGLADLTVKLSTSPHASSADASEDMARNVGVDELRVYSGRVRVPSSPRVRGFCVDWDAQNSVQIAFSTAFPYRGGTLCIDLAGAPVAGATSPFWPADARSDSIEGTVRMVGASCQDPSLVIPVDGGDTHKISGQHLVPGGSVLSFARGAPGASASLILGLDERRPALNLGFLGAPRCFLWVDILVVLPPEIVSPPIVPAKPYIGGYVSSRIYIPPSPSLFAARFAAQWVEFRGASLATTNAAVCTIASRMPSLGMALVSARFQGGSPPARGSVDRRVAHVLRFEYR